MLLNEIKPANIGPSAASRLGIERIMGNRLKDLGYERRDGKKRTFNTPRSVDPNAAVFTRKLEIEGMGIPMSFKVWCDGPGTFIVELNAYSHSKDDTIFRELEHETLQVTSADELANEVRAAEKRLILAVRKQWPERDKIYDEGQQEIKRIVETITGAEIEFFSSLLKVAHVTSSSEFRLYAYAGAHVLTIAMDDEELTDFFLRIAKSKLQRFLDLPEISSYTGARSYVALGFDNFPGISKRDAPAMAIHIQFIDLKLARATKKQKHFYDLVRDALLNSERINYIKRALEAKL